MVSPRPLTLSASVRLSTTLPGSSPACPDEVEKRRRDRFHALSVYFPLVKTDVAQERGGEVGTLQVGARAPVALKAVGKLPVGELSRSGQGGVAGDGQGRVEVAGRHGG